MPIPFERFRLLNETDRKVENVDYQRALRVKVDEHPEVVVPPGQTVSIPEGVIIEVTAEEVP